MSSQRELRGGCLRAVREDGTEAVACPGDAMYSSVTMFATECWDEATQSWKPIFEDDDAEPTA